MIYRSWLENIGENFSGIQRGIGFIEVGEIEFGLRCYFLSWSPIQPSPPSPVYPPLEYGVHPLAALSNKVFPYVSSDSVVSESLKSFSLGVTKQFETGYKMVITIIRFEYNHMQDITLTGERVYRKPVNQYYLGTVEMGFVPEDRILALELR